MEKQRWWFTEKELESFDNTCECLDEFIVFPCCGSKWAKERGVLIYRDGTATDRYGDGTIGVSSDDRVFAEEEEELHCPDDLDVLGKWEDVRVDEHGFFLNLIKEEKPTVVIFRRWRAKPKSVIAIFPEIPATVNLEHCQSYEHVEQHGACSPDHLIYRKTCRAGENEKDVQALKKELESLGYILIIRQRMTQKHLEARRNALNEM